MRDYALTIQSTTEKYEARLLVNKIEDVLDRT
jgi:hypothetical protein